MVTATTGTLRFRGVSGTPYSVSIYISDVIGANVLFNLNGVAGSGSDKQIRFGERVMLEDASIISNPTVMTGFYLTADGGIVVGSSTLIATNYTTLNSRNCPNVRFEAGRIIGAIQF